MSLLAGPSSDTPLDYEIVDLDFLEADDDLHNDHETIDVDLEVDYCQEWDEGTCTKGEKCRFRHRKIPKHYGRRRYRAYDNWLLDFAAKLTVDDDDEDDNLEPGPQQQRGQEETNTSENAGGMVMKEWEFVSKDLESTNQGEDIIHQSPAVSADQRQLEDTHSPEEPVQKTTTGDDVLQVLRELGQKRREEYSSMGSEDNLFRERSKQPATIGQYIVLESNLVTCGAGLEIRKVVPGYDLCQISFYLPSDTKRDEIEDVLLTQGLSSADFQIHKIEEKGAALEVTVITDARLGKNLSEPGKQPWERVSFEVRHDAVWTSGYMQGSQPTLTLSWSINGDTHSNDSLSAALGMVYERLNESEGARMETCCVLTPEMGSAANRVTLILEFDSWENAQGAARAIEANGPKIRSFECTLPTIYEHAITIPLAQYEAQLEQWLGMSDTKAKKKKEEGRASIHIAISRDVVNVRIQGDERRSVGAFKVRIERLARGDVLEGLYWHPSFASAEDSEVFLRNVMESAQVYLRCDPHLRILRVYGTPERVGQVQRMIREEVARREKIVTRTALPGSSIDFFIIDGFGRLQELVGNENVELKITTKWSAIMMQGGEEATHHLRRLLEKSGQPLAQAIKANPTCPVCLNEALYPEMLGCGHGYCSGCFNGFLKAAADNKTFPVVCLGNEGKCKAPIALSIIQDFLPHYDFNHLVEVAFASYLEKNPTELRYCRTPDCRQTYRRQTRPARHHHLVCPSCFIRTCPSCGEDHKDMTCDEYRIYRDPEEQERLNNQLAVKSGFKRCPRCAVWVEKVSGCNHMSCKCGAHICWICLGVFEPGTIYDHIRTHQG